MNILPKKRWHVRTRENIARVRKDEAEAAAKEKEEQLRIENADREARLNVLKLKAKQKLIDSSASIDTPSISLEAHFSTSLEEPGTSTSKPEHVNLFNDLEHSTSKTNKEHDLEVKNKKEEYEKQIGYLTYLGQDTNESLGKKNWYDVLPDSFRYNRSDDIKETYTKLQLKDADGKSKVIVPDIKNGEVSWKTKQSLDPMNPFRHLSSKINRSSKTVTSHAVEKIAETKSNYTAKRSKHKKHHKKHSEKERTKDKGKEEKLNKLQKLREARIRREQEERRKTRLFLTEISGIKPDLPQEKQPTRIKPKYNSQFNPELARQNFT